jgi:hypothetical protein
VFFLAPAPYCLRFTYATPGLSRNVEDANGPGRVWGTERLLPAIPTHPISWADARPFLRNLAGAEVPHAFPSFAVRFD